MNKIYYEVTYTPSGMALKISDLMTKLDLGISGVCTTEEFSWRTTSKIDKKYINKMKGAIEESIEKAGGKVREIKYKYHKICL